MGHHNRSPLVDRLSFGAPARTTLVRECKGCPGTLCKGCHGTGQPPRLSSTPCQSSKPYAWSSASFLQTMQTLWLASSPIHKPCVSIPPPLIAQMSKTDRPQRYRYAKDGHGLWAMDSEVNRRAHRRLRPHRSGRRWREGSRDRVPCPPRSLGRGWRRKPACACRDYGFSRYANRLVSIIRPENLPSRA